MCLLSVIFYVGLFSGFKDLVVVEFVRFAVVAYMLNFSLRSSTTFVSGLWLGETWNGISIFREFGQVCGHSSVCFCMHDCRNWGRRKIW